jgi:uncharacterized protein
MHLHGVEIPDDKIADFCRRHGVKRLSLFGSILREDFGPESDVDVLVEFEEGVRIGLLGVARMELELSEMLGRSVDIRTAADLSPHFRDKVVRGARLLHAA